MVSNQGCLQFPVGAAKIDCTAPNEAGLSTSGSFTVTVTDQPPTIVCPTDVCVECAANGTSSVSFSVSASDVQQGDISNLVHCDHSSGASYPLGSTQVTCSVLDCFGLSSSCAFKINVQDTTPPQIVCPAIPPATCPAAQSFVAVATDACTSVSYTCTPSSFTPILPQASLVAVSQPTRQAITRAAHLIIPWSTYATRFDAAANQTVAAESCIGAAVCYTVTATDNCEMQGITCEFANGTPAPVEANQLVLPVGVNVITCVAVNAAGLSSTGSFSITVYDQHPTITCPLDITVECAANGGSHVSFSVSAAMFNKATSVR